MRGPKNGRVRLVGVLTTAEKALVKAHPSENGRVLLKAVRTCLVETARQEMEALIASITGVEVVSLHHDISSVTGEEIMVFTLSHAVLFPASPSGQTPVPRLPEHPPPSAKLLTRP